MDHLQYPKDKVWYGVLRDACIMDSDGENGDDHTMIVGLAGGTRVMIRVDHSLPSLCTDEDLAEVHDLVDNG